MIVGGVAVVTAVVGVDQKCGCLAEVVDGLPIERDTDDRVGGATVHVETAVVVLAVPAFNGTNRGQGAPREVAKRRDFRHC